MMMQAVSLPSVRSCSGCSIILKSDCIVATIIPFSSSRSSMPRVGSAPPAPQKRCMCSVVPRRPTSSKTVLNVLNACSQSSLDWAIQSMNLESRCCAFFEGLPSLSHSIMVSTSMRVLPAPVGMDIILRFASLSFSTMVPSSILRTTIPVVNW